MIYKGKDPVEGREKTSEQLFSDEKTDEKIRRHFSDINDVITEADIASVKTDFDENVESGTGKSPAPKPTKPQAGTGGEDDNKEGEEKEPTPVITPWNILNP